VPGAAGTYDVGEHELTFTEPAHTGPTGKSLGQRMLVTQIWYPQAQRSPVSQPARGPFPLIVFAPGFVQCVSTYTDLLKAWAGAGYVVAAVTFPRTNCGLGEDAYEPDLVNQPQDVSYVLTRLLALNAQPDNALSDLLNPREVAAAGQSDGGDTVAALAANTCCTDHRLKAVAVLSGAEWPPMPGQYFSGGAPPMLFVQGSADTINPPWTSVQLYSADHADARYYLDLFGVTHLTPYEGTNPIERLVARVTLEFFDRYVLGQSGAAEKMTDDGNVSGTAALVSGGQPPP
jgi:dienelactone hydrolase